jgi:hypothetical protein
MTLDQCRRRKTFTAAKNLLLLALKRKHRSGIKRGFDHPITADAVVDASAQLLVATATSLQAVSFHLLYLLTVAETPRTIAIIETNDAVERQNTTRTLTML